MPDQQTAKPQYSVSNLPQLIQHWKDAVEGGSSPEQIAQNCYHKDALLKGTVSVNFVRGREDIAQYFAEFTQGRNNIRVEFNSLYQSPSGSFSGEYTFHWTDIEDQAQALKANYTFEAVENAHGGNVISLHHSSFQ